MRILLIEDDKAVASAVGTYLEGEGFEIDIVHDGLIGLEYMLSNIYDIILLDVMLPRLNGMDALKNARAEGIKTPVIMLTAKSQIEDKLQGFDCGADDYMTKPFEMRELLARIKVRTRQDSNYSGHKMEVYDIWLDRTTYKLHCADRSVKLSNKEFQLMEYLMINRGQILTREMILSKIWGFDDKANFSSIEVYIHFIRKKLDFVKSRATVITSKGIGYSLEEGEDD